MTVRKHTPLHDKWHPRVEGQIRDCLTSHPEWFSFKSKADQANCVNSLAKRIVGEIVTEFTLQEAQYRKMENSYILQIIEQNSGAGVRLATGTGAVTRRCCAVGPWLIVYIKIYKK